MCEKQHKLHVPSSTLWLGGLVGHLAWALGQGAGWRGRVGLTPCHRPLGPLHLCYHSSLHETEPHIPKLTQLVHNTQESTLWSPPLPAMPDSTVSPHSCPLPKKTASIFFL